MECAGKRHASSQILEQRNDSGYAALVDQTPHGPRRRRVGDFGVAPGNPEKLPCSFDNSGRGGARQRVLPRLPIPAARAPWRDPRSPMPARCGQPTSRPPHERIRVTARDRALPAAPRRDQAAPEYDRRTLPLTSRQPRDLAELFVVCRAQRSQAEMGKRRAHCRSGSTPLRAARGPHERLVRRRPPRTAP